MTLALQTTPGGGAGLDDAKPLSPTDEASLVDLVKTVEQGFQVVRKTYFEMGKALAEIRDRRLYRGRYQTFDAYLSERWDRSRSYVSRMIAASGVAEHLLPIGNSGRELPAPVSESQLRPSSGCTTPPYKRKPTGGRSRRPAGASRPPHRSRRPRRKSPPPKPSDPVTKAKAAGIVPHAAEVEVTHPEAGGPETEPAATAKPTDAEWLDAMPERSKMSDRVREKFDDEALTYRRLLAFRDACQKFTKLLIKKHHGHIGPWLAKHKLHFRINDPHDWRACGECHGQGISALLNAACPACHGEGYHV